METKNQNLGELLPINENNGKRAVNARDLYLFLGYDKSQWARWYTTNIVNNDFAEEGIDYQTFDIVSNGNATKEFALSIDFAKELSMLARNERGKQARKYFIACEQSLKTALLPKKQSVTPTKVRASIEWVKGVSEILNLNDSSKLLLLGKVAKPLELPLPDYTPSKGILKSASELLKERGLQISSREFNTRAIEKGFLCEMERKSKHGAKKFFKSITKKGLPFGENQVSPHNPNSTQPHWYVEKFDELLGLVGIQIAGGLVYGN